MSTMNRSKAVSLALAALLVLGAMAVPALSQAAVDSLPGQAEANAARLAPVAPPPSPAPPQAGATPTNTLTPTQQLQALEQQMRAAYNSSQWAEVLRLIGEMRVIDPYYKADELREIEFRTHLSHGWDLMLQGKCLEAMDQFRLALHIKPGDAEANQGLDAVARYCKTPVPTATTSLTVTVTTTVTTTATSPTGGFSYTVQPGDTLYSIGKKFGVSVQSIMTLNGLSSYAIWAGQVLQIPGTATITPTTPGPTPTGTLIPPPTPTAPPTPIAHLVQPGETLCSLARRYNTTVWAIMAYNRLYTTTIFAFTVLYIPPVGQAGPVTHVVQPGNTLYSIAKAYGSSVSAIMAANGLTNFIIYVGQHLIVPVGGWYPGYPTGDPCGAPAYSQTYVVKPGDTLYSISRAFGVTIEALKAANGLTGTLIYAGTVLYIPA
jgi:LysM repeat protein